MDMPEMILAHTSDCAKHNAPAMVARECDCPANVARRYLALSARDTVAFEDFVSERIAVRSA